MQQVRKKVRGPYYECNVWGYAVLPGVEVRRHACSHPDRVIKLLSPKGVRTLLRQAKGVERPSTPHSAAMLIP